MKLTLMMAEGDRLNRAQPFGLFVAKTILISRSSLVVCTSEWYALQAIVLTYSVFQFAEVHLTFLTP
jgi:hypothetical protein